MAHLANNLNNAAYDTSTEILMRLIENDEFVEITCVSACARKNIEHRDKQSQSLLALNELVSQVEEGAALGRSVMPFPISTFSKDVFSSELLRELLNRLHQGSSTHK